MSGRPNLVVALPPALLQRSYSDDVLRVAASIAIGNYHRSSAACLAVCIRSRTPHFISPFLSGAFPLAIRPGCAIAEHWAEHLIETLAGARRTRLRIDRLLARSLATLHASPGPASLAAFGSLGLQSALRGDPHWHATCFCSVQSRPLTATGVGKPSA